MAVFLYGKIGANILIVMGRFVHFEFLLANYSIKLICINLDDDGLLLPVSSVNVGFGAKALIKKIFTTVLPLQKNLPVLLSRMQFCKIMLCLHDKFS